ncbi:MAG: (2Fe-2S)-binding protein [Gemmataceae bacterium]|nr:(2Fe-2S)-binding protein [Gemmataceae bacterium]
MRTCLVALEQQKIICHCLGITEQQILELKILKNVQTVREVMNETEAGSGCTACHRKIRDLLENPEKICR